MAEWPELSWERRKKTWCITLPHFKLYYKAAIVKTVQYCQKNKKTKTDTYICGMKCMHAQLCPTLCNPMDCSMPGLSVPYYLQKFAQVHVHCTGDAIQPSHPLIPSSSALTLSISGNFPMSQVFASDDQNTGVSASVSVLPASVQGWFPLRLTGLISLLSRGLSDVFSSTTVRRYQFFGARPSSQSNSHIHTWPVGKP